MLAKGRYLKVKGKLPQNKANIEPRPAQGSSFPHTHCKKEFLQNKIVDPDKIY